MLRNPSTFKLIYIKKVDDYLKIRCDKVTKFHKTMGDKSDTYERLIKVKLPTIEGLAIYLGVARKTLYNWEKEYPSFAAALDRVRIEQLQRLIDSGLSGDYNPIIAKLMLSHNHGMREKSDVTSDDKPLNTFSDDQIDRIADRIASRKGSNGDTPSA